MKSYKIAYISDLHLHHKKPINRNCDNFLKLQDVKFINIFKKIIHADVDKLLQGGDFFHSPIPAFDFFLRILSVLLFFNKKQPSLFPISLVLGNHDLLGHNKTLIDNTAMGLLKTLNLIDTSDNIINCDGFDIIIKKLHYLDSFDDIQWPESNPYCKTYKILMIHSMAVPQKISPLLNHGHTIIENMGIKRDVNLVLCSHFHKSFVLNLDSTVFVNPGVVMRRSIDEGNEIPKILYFTFTEDGISVSGEKIADKADFQKKTINKFEFLNVSNDISVVSNDWRVFYNELKKTKKFDIDIFDMMDNILKEAVKDAGIEFN